MKIKYLFSSPEGDIEIDEHILSLPLKLSLDRKHSWLRLKDYFDLISSFALRKLPKDRIRALLVRSENMGHIIMWQVSNLLIMKGNDGNLGYLWAYPTRVYILKKNTG